MRVLGIETSCDETSVAVVDGRTVRSNVVYSQIAQHEPWGGVVPEIASRAHVERLPDILTEALRTAGAGWGDLDAIAVTHGPGLATSLLVGVVAAKALAVRLDRPLYAVNHLAGHLYSIFLGPDVPAGEGEGVVLLVSGGHTSLLRVRGPRDIRMLGETLDDAAGEALDKGAKLLKLGYPGGPAIERTAQGGNPAAVRFPRGMGPGTEGIETGGLGRDLCFSFSGLKTALLYHLRDRPGLTDDPQALRDVAASYQEAVVDALLERVDRACERLRPTWIGCAGGVARNRGLREKMAAFGRSAGLPVAVAPPEFCTDNAAMIAAAAAAGLGRKVVPVANLDVEPSAPLC